jgi:very-short-patch-repair endonuclease
MKLSLPSPVASEHPLPQGERGKIRPLTEVAKEQQERRRNTPSPLAGEGVSRRLTGEGFAKRQAKHLRHDMTEAETKLWQALRGKKFDGYKFRRQVAIGIYIVDFVCFAQKLIVEVDGSQHESSTHDEKRDAWLDSQGFRVLRLWNNDVLQSLDYTMLAILNALTLPSPASLVRGTLSRKGRGKGDLS